MGDLDSNKTQLNGTQVPTGHPTGFWFFFWGEFAERCSYYGMRAIMALYMTDVLGISKANGGTFMALFIALCYFLPLLGGWIADNYLGKYWTIVGFSIPYVAGQVMVGIPDKWFLFISLLLLAMGSGVIKPNISTLMGLTYDQQRPGQEKLRTAAFSWFYMSINVGAALSQFAMPWLRDEYGYRVAFLFPAVFMALALGVFASGKKYYAQEVIVRRQSTPEERTLKMQTFGRIIGLFVLVMFFWAIFDQSASTWIYFADTYMNTNLFGIEVSADAIQAFNPVFIIIFLPLVMLLWKYLDSKGVRVRATDKMIAGFILTGSCMGIMAIAGFLAGKPTMVSRIEAKEVTLLLPEGSSSFGPSTLNVDKNNLEAQSGETKFGTGSLLLATQKPSIVPSGTVNFNNGELQLGKGKALYFKDGRVDFERSRALFENGKKIELPGAIEVKFKQGDYPIGGGTLSISNKGVATIEEGKTAEQQQAKPNEAPTVSLDSTEYVKPEERVTVWWQVLAYLILTIAEILISVTGLELAFVAAPPTMKSFVTACWLLTVGMANLFINAPITRIYPTMPPGIYFLMLAATIAVVTVAFVFMAGRFNRAMAEKANNDTAAISAQHGEQEGQTESV